MTAYAARTTVPIAKSKTDIENLLTQHGATAFAYATEGDSSVIAFAMSDRRVRLELEMPPIDDFARDRAGRKRAPKAQQSAWEQACRQRWRALLLIIRAKLEAVESGITTLESEFLANLVLPSGTTVGNWLTPQVAEAYRTGTMPPMLVAGRTE